MQLAASEIPSASSSSAAVATGVPVVLRFDVDDIRVLPPSSPLEPGSVRHASHGLVPALAIAAHSSSSSSAVPVVLPESSCSSFFRDLAVTSASRMGSAFSAGSSSSSSSSSSSMVPSNSQDRSLREKSLPSCAPAFRYTAATHLPAGDAALLAPSPMSVGSHSPSASAWVPQPPKPTAELATRLLARAGLRRHGTSHA